ncbi:MAG: DUF4255 domain-containing protein [Anaerolineaceae bacterium]|nr:DUF4255 domain-containing protein [Anaerolineaceae bacterium]
MIHDLDKTLEILLSHELPPELVGQISISFAAPDDQFPPSTVTTPAIDLFLYDVRENRELREMEWLVERGSGGQLNRLRAPLRIDCSYLITAWPSESSNNPVEDEHRLLGVVMLALLRHPTLPVGILQGSLQGQEPQLPTTMLQPGRLQSLAEFWQALGGKPKAALNYTVTLGVQVHQPEEVGMVVEKIIKFKQGPEAK